MNEPFLKLIGSFMVLVPLLSITGYAQAGVAKPLRQPLTKEERIQGLLTIHAAAKQHFARFDRVPHLDWDRAFVEYLPRVEPDQGLYEYYRVLQRFVALLEDGHTSVRLPEQVQQGLDLLPFQLEFIEDQWVVVQRYPVAEIVQEDVPVGSALTSLEGLPAATYFRERVYPYIPAGSEHLKRSSVNWAATFPRHTNVAVELRYPNGAFHRRVLRANRSTVAWSDDLKRKFTPLEQPPPFSFRRLPDDLLLVRYGVCDAAGEEQFSKLIASTRDRWPRALMLDLRDNPGGNTPHRLVAHLLSQPTKVWVRSTRCAISEFDAQLQAAKRNGASAKTIAEAIEPAIKRGDLPKGYSPGWISTEGVLEPEAIHYDGPLYVLVNGNTGSAAEDVAAMLQGCGRATIVGAATAGSTGNSLALDLPGGGGVRICAVQVKFADGRDFVPRGVRPDFPVARTIAGIVQGQDEALQAALALARQKLGESGPGKHPRGQEAGKL